ncbi:MAG: lysophospholipid acyltransferase family protein [Cyanobacteria bacterium MAG IRC3_bin_20]|nr:lysophospholipid acyltransferase family protein [Cyanobacteria bacterium MAG IRC3_bin_20]
MGDNSNLLPPAPAAPRGARTSYWLLRTLVVNPLFRLVFHGRVEGRPPAYRGNPYVVVANHGSDLDPPLLSCAMGRPVSFMAKQELFHVPLLAPLIRGLGAVPVRRGHVDRRALDRCLAQLQRGWLVGVFLDGTRSPTGMVERPRHGAALLAQRSGCPLLPVAILNSHRALSRGSMGLKLVPIIIRIGAPIPAPASRDRQTMEATSQRCAAVINGLLTGAPLPGSGPEQAS